MRVAFRTGLLTRPVLLGSVLAILAFGLWMVAAPEQSAARERRSLLNGRFELIVGFVDEPPYEGVPNGLYVRVTDSLEPTPTPDPDVTPTPDPIATPGAEPEPEETALKAEIFYADQTRPLNLTQDAADPTIYRATFVPTQPGDYVFRIFGTLAGTEFDEEFRSGPDTFPGVIGVGGDVQFPAEIPVGQGLLDAFAEAEEDSDRARTFGVAGVLLGVIGLIAGGLAVVLSRRPRPPGPHEDGSRTAPIAPSHLQELE